MSVQNKKTREHTDREKELRNEDPLSGAAGAHPVGAGIGAAIGGAATGALVGAAAGPVGTAVGTVVGGVVGGLAGKSVAEGYDPTIETDYWRNEHRNRPYYNDAYSFDDYEPAYRAGWESRDADASAEWADREATARDRWESSGGESYMTWDEARLASEDAYNRVRIPKKKAR